MTIHNQLIEEARCTLGLCRSSQGNITLTFKTHTTGAVKIELGPEQFADIVFGLQEVQCSIANVHANRKPSYPK